MDKWLNTYLIIISEGEDRKCSKSCISINSGWEFSETDDRNQSTDSKK